VIQVFLYCEMCRHFNTKSADSVIAERMRQFSRNISVHLHGWWVKRENICQSNACVSVGSKDYSKMYKKKTKMTCAIRISLYIEMYIEDLGYG
jgi:hypothetical protein